MNNGSTHILLIEDNPGDADLVRLRLVEAHSDAAVSCATRLSTGLASMLVETPTMVLLDLNLPDSQAQKPIARCWSRLPVFLSSCWRAWKTKKWRPAPSTRESRTIW